MFNFKKIILYIIFGFFSLNNNLSYSVGVVKINDKDIDNAIEGMVPGGKPGFRVTPKQIGQFAKYGAAALSLLYAINGAKKAVESVKLLIPVDQDLKFTDLLKFPFRLLMFPFKAIDVGRCFLIAGSMGVLSYGLHKVGA